MLVYFPRLILLDSLIVLIKFALNQFEFDNTLIDYLTKFFLIISPIYPTMKVWSCRDEFGGPEGITDGVIDSCIGIWFALILSVIVFF